MNGLKIAVLGAHDTVVGFKALGLDTFAADDPQRALEHFRQLTREDSGYAIIYIEEGLAAGLTDEIAAFKDDPAKAIILIPGRSGPLGLGSGALQAAIERAVGSKMEY